MTTASAYDLIVVGAGLVGLATAYNAQRRHPQWRILILEKEGKEACHQSGNNSGVIHSGIYYKPKSAKAINCIRGYRQTIDFAEQHDIDYDICGKIIVATTSDELPMLDQIMQRGIQNGLTGLTKLCREQFREIEPHCEGLSAIKVPQTGIIDYKGMASKLAELFCVHGGEVLFHQKVERIHHQKKPYTVQTQQHEFVANRIVSCAGLYSDKVSQMTSEKEDVRIIPFRGEYYKLKDDKKHLIKNLIYPVPDPKFPFLGVHFTRMIDGEVEAGPNAVLAFQKEGYRFFDINLNELVHTLSWPGFHKIVMKYGRTGMGEMYRSLSKKAFVRALQKLVPEVMEGDLEKGGAGVRAQACHRDGTLLDDFDIIDQQGIVHVRNAPSPAATSCLSIGDTIVDMIS